MWLQKMVELFFQQLSPQIYTTLSKKLLHFVTYNVVPNATKEVIPEKYIAKLSHSFTLLNPDSCERTQFGFLVASASLANPEAALKAYLPLCYKKVIKLSKETGAGTGGFHVNAWLGRERV